MSYDIKTHPFQHVDGRLVRKPRPIELPLIREKCDHKYRVGAKPEHCARCGIPMEEEK